MKGTPEHKGLDIDRFREIFDANYEKIRSFIYFRTGDTALADDITQEVFLKVWDIRDEIRAETIRPLLYTIAGNMVKNHFNRKKVEYNFIRDTNLQTVAEPADYDIRTEEFDRLLQDTLAAIPEKSRTVFLMNRIDKLTYPEIAESLGISVKAVEKRMKTALAYIRKHIQFKF